MEEKNNVSFMVVEENIDTNGYKTRTQKEVPMTIFFKCIRKIFSNAEISTKISEIESENQKLNETLKTQNKEIEALKKAIKELTLKITPVVDDYIASQHRPRTLYGKSVGQFISINEKFENASAYILRQTINEGKPMISPLNSLMKFMIEPEYKIKQKDFSIINKDERRLKNIYKEIVEFHKESFKNINSYLESKGITIDKCVKLLDGNTFLPDFMEYKAGCNEQSTGKVFVLSLFYDFPDINAKHKAMVYPNIIKA